MTILYITQNGITDHIGRSQVAPYLLGLAQKGYKIHLLSAEKKGRTELVDIYKDIFSNVGISWTRTTYRMNPPIMGQAFTQARLQYLAQSIVCKNDIKLLHCRSHPAALIGEKIFDFKGIPYIFDFRDFYADGGLEKTAGFRRQLFKKIKKREKEMIRKAAHVVCLTEKAKSILIDWYLQDTINPNQLFSVIPCCADFSHFNPTKISDHARERARLSVAIPEQATTLVYLGALGEDYLLEPMLRLFKQLLSIDPASIFLFIANNGSDLVSTALKRLAIPSRSVRFVSVQREDVPAFLSLASLSVIFIRSTLSKAGCSPTKLAELLAMNIPVIANTGVGDMDSIINLSTNGSVVVSDFHDSTLRSALKTVISTAANQHVRIRSNSMNFNLPAGIHKYQSVYDLILPAP